jgi:transposase InsO family protein
LNFVCENNNLNGGEMSQLKRQLMKLLPEIAHEAKSLKEVKAKQRYRDLKYVVFSSQTVEVACKLRCISRDYFEKWAKRVLELKSLRALFSRSQAPKRQPGKSSQHIEKKVLAYRTKKPFLGCERIKHDLKLKASKSTVNRILNRQGCIAKKKAKRLTKKHLKRYRRPLPGYLQMDFKYVPYSIGGKQYYQLSCVDHHSSWRLIRAYSNKDLIAVEDFLLTLERECPFPIIELQTDNDTSFTDKFWTDRPGTISGLHLVDEWCARQKVRHKLIPVGEKELNGKVENTHKQDDREFFSQINPSSLEELEIFTYRHEWHWNNERRTKVLGWKTPREILERAYLKVLFWALYFTRQKETRRKTKRISAVDRYLTWMEEDAKKYGT